MNKYTNLYKSQELLNYLIKQYLEKRGKDSSLDSIIAFEKELYKRVIKDE